jgi:hypothetical protein
MDFLGTELRVKCRDLVTQGRGSILGAKPPASCPSWPVPSLPRNWEPFQGSCYLFFRTLGSWETLISACRDLGAHLVIINSLEEQVSWTRVTPGAGPCNWSTKVLCHLTVSLRVRGQWAASVSGGDAGREGFPEEES